MTTAEGSMSRPRWVWAGTAAGVAGLALVGLAASLRNWWLTLGGALVLGAGISVARHGRTQRDVPTTRAESDTTTHVAVEPVRREEPEHGVNPGPMIQDERVWVDSRQTEARHRRAVHTPTPGRRMGPAGAALLLVAAFLLVAAQLSMFPNTRVGEGNATFMVAPTVVLALVGLNGVARPGQSHRLAGALGLLAGLAVVAIAVFNPHQVVGTEVLELVCGTAGILGALPLLASR